MPTLSWEVVENIKLANFFCIQYRVFTFHVVIVGALKGTRL